MGRKRGREGGREGGEIRGGEMVKMEEELPIRSKEKEQQVIKSYCDKAMGSTVMQCR